MFSTIPPVSLNDTTVTLPNMHMTTTTNSGEPAPVYDHQGAALYIAVILVWYSTGLAMMLFLQVRPRTLQQQFSYDSSDTSKKVHVPSVNSNPFTNYRNVQADDTTKKILNELKDPERRQRLWKIYYASAEKQNEPYPQYYQTITSDGVTINRIKRKLADIHRITSTQNENTVLSTATVPSNDNRLLTSPFDSTKFFTKRFTALRRPNGGATNSRSPFVRAHSQTDTIPANYTVEMEPFVSDNQSSATLVKDVRRQDKTVSDRFLIEKVPDDNASE